MLVKVWNDNVHPFSQTWREKTYKIPAKQCIELEYDEADAFIKAYSPIVPDYDNNPKPESYKMLRIDEKDLEKMRNLLHNRAKSGSYICQACGYVASNKWELNGHALDQHKEQLEDVQAAEAAVLADDAKKKGK